MNITPDIIHKFVKKFIIKAKKQNKKNTLLTNNIISEYKKHCRSSRDKCYLVSTIRGDGGPYKELHAPGAVSGEAAAPAESAESVDSIRLCDSSISGREILLGSRGVVSKGVIVSSAGKVVLQELY